MLRWEVVLQTAPMMGRVGREAQMRLAITL